MKKYALTTIMSLLAAVSFAQFKVAGTLLDKETNLGLFSATVYVIETQQGTTTDFDGNFTLSLPKGKYNIKLSYIGYKTDTVLLEVNKSFSKTFYLTTNKEVLKEVVVEAETATEKIQSTEMSVEKLDIKMVKKIPQLMGESDIIKSIQLRPGVTSVGEGATGFNVRGGNIDQNLILLDGAPVFSSSHLFGFFSVFNSDVIESANLYKGGIDAKYGGRLSSVLDVTQREGSYNKVKGEGGLGVLFSRFTIEAPIVKDKLSILASGRRSYADLFLAFNDDFKGTKAFFYDANVSISYRINEKNLLKVGGYYGDDTFKFSGQFENVWGNRTVSANWKHIFNKQWLVETSANYSNYKYYLAIPNGANAFRWDSSIESIIGKTMFTNYINKNNTLRFGVEGIKYNFHPGVAKGIGDESVLTELVVPDEYAYKASAFFSFEQKIGTRLNLKYGLRYGHFWNVGPGPVYQYQYGVPTTVNDTVGVVNYAKNQTIADYGGFEPRFAMSYLLSEESSLKFSYMHMYQYMHLISNTTAATPLDVWKPAGAYVKPAQSDQVALGFFKNFFYDNNVYEISVEGYYKWMHDLVDYRDGAQLLLNPYIETALLTGSGYSYGTEFMIEKKKGKLNGWLAYTWSKTRLTVPGFVAGDYTDYSQGINLGEPYPSNWDKLHDVKLIVQYELNDKWEFATTTTYMTGRPATYPEGKFYFDGVGAPVYRFRNKYRIPDYFRFDVGVNLTPQKERKGSWESSWAFGVYNLTGRNNAYSIFFQPNSENPTQTQAMKLSIVGIPVPYITYNFSF